MKVIIKARRDLDTKSGNPYHDEEGKFASSDTVIAPKWYLKSKKLLESWQGSTMTAGQLSSMLKQVSQDELKWTGLDKFLKGISDPNIKIKRDDVLAQIIEPNIKEIVLQVPKRTKKDTPPVQGLAEVTAALKEYVTGQKSDDYLTRQNWRRKLDETPTFELTDQKGKKYFLEVRSSWNGKLRAELYSNNEDPSARWSKIYLGSVRTKVPGLVTRMVVKEILGEKAENWEKPIYSKYTAPGGTQYTEMVFTISPEDVSRVLGADEVYNSHWARAGAKNVIAHVRYKTRQLDGKKTLFIEEVQSDTHERGREQGYTLSDEERRNLTRRAEELDSKLLWEGGSVIKYIRDSLPAGMTASYATGTKFILYKDEKEVGKISGTKFDWVGWRQPKFDNESGTYTTETGVPVSKKEYDAIESITSEVSKQLNELVEARKALAADTVPKLPFSSTWDKFIFRRMIREAVEKGYNQIAWTSGVMQALRYNLSYAFKEVKLTPQDGNKVLITAEKRGVFGSPTTYSVPTSVLVDYIGKDLSEKYEGKEISFSSDELRKAGTAGMNAFYDRILPSTMREIIQPFGGTVDTTTMQVKLRGDDEPVPYTVHRVVLTPELKKAALGKGFPLFKSMCIIKSV